MEMSCGDVGMLAGGIGLSTSEGELDDELRETRIFEFEEEF